MKTYLTMMLLFFAISAVTAQDKKDKATEGLKQITKDLNLSSQQTQQVNDILTGNRESVKALLGDKDIKPKERAEKINKLLLERDEALGKVLTQKQVKDMKVKMSEHLQAGREEMQQKIKAKEKEEQGKRGVNTIKN